MRIITDAQWRTNQATLRRLRETLEREAYARKQLEAEIVHLKAAHLEQMEDKYDKALSDCWDEVHQLAYDEGWQDGFSDGCEAMSEASDE
jgi:flagellar biosynthesis/type III secretory pathway protein FliH